jgi:uncharacterized protein with FMN-binding domain
MDAAARRTLPVVFALVLSLLLLSCSAGDAGGPPEAPAVGSLRDGSYVGAAFHFPVFARVQVRVAGGRIAAVRILGHFSSEHGKPAEALASTIVERQGVAVDAVAGATYSSEVILRAAGRALRKARGS